VVLGQRYALSYFDDRPAEPVNTKANLYQSLFDTLYKEFHPRSLHYAGLSGGVECGGWLLTYQSTLGDEHVMARIQSFVNLSGVAPSFPSGENEQGAQPLPYPQVWGYWAHKYHGEILVLIGNTDNQTSTYLIEQMMNDSVPGSAYFLMGEYRRQRQPLLLEYHV
jgi:hypothetical protein